MNPQVPPERRQLDAKLHTATRSAGAVSRRSVEEALVHHPTARVILACAPAGFGKTTAMLQLRGQVAGSMPTGWLTLDRADNDATRLLRGLAAALEPIVPSADGASAPALFEALAARDAPFALFLDDFEVLQESATLALVRELLERLPAQGRVVIGSRVLPEALRLARLRARGLLLEIDTSQLRFTREEAAAFFAARHQPALEPRHVEALHARTEGWIAALALASLALERTADRDDFVARFSGSERMVADYLSEEVLGSQEAGVRDFLLRTSILRHLEPALCDAVLPREHSAQLLERLESANLLITRVGTDRPVYRLHSMFGRFLRNRLGTQAPAAEIAALHRRASAWYEQEGRPVPAIDHAIEARDTSAAVRLLERHGGGLLAQGRMRLLAQWLERLPADQMRERDPLQVLQAWAACFTHGAARASRLLEASSLAAATDPAIQAHVSALRCVILAMTDRYEEAWREGRAALTGGPSGSAFADAVLANTMSTVFAAMGDNDGARRLLASARSSQGQQRSAFNLMFSETAEGFIDLQEGRMRQAAARFRAAVSASGDHGSAAHGNAWAGIPYAASLYEDNELDAASHLLEIYLPLACDVGVPDQVATGHVLQSRIAFHRGDIDQAYRSLMALEYFGHERRLPRLVACAHLERARAHILKRHFPAAHSELDLADDRALWEPAERLRLPANDVEYVGLGRLRLALHEGDPADAAARLEAELGKARSALRERRAFKLLLLRCMALHRAGREEWKLLASDVLRQAHAERYVRLVLDEGPVAGAMLREHARLPALGLSADVRAYEDFLLACFAPTLPGESEADADTAAMLLEPLTKKESAVLVLLADGYSNAAMAEKLFVSENTVRTHLRNAYSKLQARSRTQAVAHARRLGLVS